VVCFQHISSFSNVLSLSLFRQNVAMSPAQLNSRSTAADDVSDVLYLMKTVCTSGVRSTGFGVFIKPSQYSAYIISFHHIDNMDAGLYRPLYPMSRNV